MFSAQIRKLILKASSLNIFYSLLRSLNPCTATYWKDADEMGHQFRTWQTSEERESSDVQPRFSWVAFLDFLGVDFSSSEFDLSSLPELSFLVGLEGVFTFMSRLIIFIAWLIWRTFLFLAAGLDTFFSATFFGAGLSSSLLLSSSDDSSFLTANLTTDLVFGFSSSSSLLCSEELSSFDCTSCTSFAGLWFF